MESQRNSCMKFLGEYWALFIKMLLLTKRKRTQTIVEFLLAYIFVALLLAMRYLLDRSYSPAQQIPPFRPFDLMTNDSTSANKTFYYPNNTCTQTIMNTALDNLASNVPDFPVDLEVIPNPTISALPTSTLSSIYAYIYFTNIDPACDNPASMPDQVQYTLRMQENGLTSYRAQQVKRLESDAYWAFSPEDSCLNNDTTTNYTTQFLGVQYFVDLAIIQYITAVPQDQSSVYLNHFGCPAVYTDQLHSGFRFFIPLFFAIIYVVTFLLNLGYIVEERANKTKEYLRIFGLRTWVNNLVWMTRSMFIYFILTGVITGLAMVTFKSTGNLSTSVDRALFNHTHWTVLWTILFVYSIHVSTFTVFFGQFFKRALLAKLLGFVIWIITFIDFYPTASVGLRYFLCFFPNIGMLFCIQVLQQFERRSGEMITFNHLYWNIFPYPLYIGLCLLMMLIYSVIYFFLAIYVERVNPGEFGVSQPWNYLCRKSYWTSSVQPTSGKMDSDRISSPNHWIETKNTSKLKRPTMIIDRLNKRFGKFQAVTNLSLDFYDGEVCTLLGQNGAGKTTTTFILVGMLQPTSGEVIIEGLDNQLQIEEVRHSLGFCPQYNILYDDLSVEEHLQLIARMRQMDKQTRKESIDTILHLIGLTNDRGTLSKNLSGGMKRRLSIGISLVKDPKVIILDEPTSGIDPANRRLIWTIIRKLKLSGKCVLLTTHFLEEADVLSDRIAIMSRGRLQASGTPDFLKQQTECEYRLSMDRQDQSSSERITGFLRKYISNIVLERESAAELIYGVKRGDSQQIERLINALDEHKQTIGINSYGLSMTTIEDVFLRLVEEEEEEDQEQNPKNFGKQFNDRKNTLSHDLVFRKQYERISDARLFWIHIRALLIKRWHVARRQISLFLGFFLLTILIQILVVAALPTPQQIQTTLLNNERVTDASVTLIPSIYNPQTIVAYANRDAHPVRTRLMSYLESTGASIDQIPNDDILNYVRERYRQSAEVFLNKYQLSFAAYYNDTVPPALQMNAYFSTVQYHTMPTSLGVAATNLFQFYANSSTKSIVTSNQPIITPTSQTSYIAQILEVLYCFEVFPVSLFGLFNAIVATIFTGILLLPLVTERLNHSKDLQLLTNLKKRIYWISNWIFDFSLCLILVVLLTIVVKIGAEAHSKSDAEVRVYQNSDATGYFFLMYFMYILASLPFVYVFSFIPKTSIMAFTNFFILNVILIIVDSVLATFPVFSQNDSPGDGPSGIYVASTNIRWIFAVLLPTVNFKQALGNIQLRGNPICIGVSNSFLGTEFKTDRAWMSVTRPGLGAQLIIFCVQIFFWCVVLILIENRLRLRRCGRRDGTDKTVSADQWDDFHLDEDVRRERQLILRDNDTTRSSVILVRDLVKGFGKSKSKKSTKGVHYAVDHLNFHVKQRACFGLLGANGAGKTTTFRMLINDIKPTAGRILINGKNINQMQRDFEIGFCPQFDWLVYDLTVAETLLLFARLKGIVTSEIPEMCQSMTQIFGLEMYEERLVQKLSGGNKRKLSAAIAFMANPTLVFLDEPTTGLDAGAKRKLWKVVRSARDVGLTIIMTSHSMEECEALCTKIGIMKKGQFVCLGKLQHLRNRFGTGYSVQIKVAGENMEKVKMNLIASLPGIDIQDQHNEVLFCNVPFASTTTTSTRSRRNSVALSFNLAHVFKVLNATKEQGIVESYSVTQTTLEQIFVQLAGQDEDVFSEPLDKNIQNAQPIVTKF